MMDVSKLRDISKVVLMHLHAAGSAEKVGRLLNMESGSVSNFRTHFTANIIRSFGRQPKEVDIKVVKVRQSSPSTRIKHQMTYVICLGKDEYLPNPSYASGYSDLGDTSGWVDIKAGQEFFFQPGSPRGFRILPDLPDAVLYYLSISYLGDK